MTTPRATDGQGTPRFGKKPARADYRTLRFRKYLGTLPTPPAAYDVLAKRVYPQLGTTNASDLFPLDANDRYGDCTIAAAAHAATTFCGMVGQRKIMPEADVVALYLQLANNTDDGLVELDVLNFWRKSGVGGETIFAFAKIDHKNHDNVKQALSTFGGVYVGFQVQQDCAADFRDGKTWVPGPLTQDGHAVFATAYDAAGVTVLTWGKAQRATWEWWDECVDEAYAILPQQAADPNFAPGFALDELKKDLAQVAVDSLQDSADTDPAQRRRSRRYTCPAGAAPIDVTDAVYTDARAVVIQPTARADAVEKTLIVECREGHYCSYPMPPDPEAGGPPANTAVEIIGTPLGPKAVTDWDALRAFADPAKGIERVDKFTTFLWGGGATLATIAGGFGVVSGGTWSGGGRLMFAAAVALMGVSMMFSMLAMMPVWARLDPNSPESIRAAISAAQVFRRKRLVPAVIFFALALVVAALVQLMNQHSDAPRLSLTYSMDSAAHLTVDAQAAGLSGGQRLYVLVRDDTASTRAPTDTAHRVYPATVKRADGSGSVAPLQLVANLKGATGAVDVLARALPADSAPDPASRKWDQTIHIPLNAWTVPSGTPAAGHGGAAARPQPAVKRDSQPRHPADTGKK